ncbi:MAG: hypothetical protein K2J37_00645, partial [Ruminococcus sp.]|nr:hypothetical protein [Ruminococcus sp.]
KIPFSQEQRELLDKMMSQVESSGIKAVSFKLFGTLVNMPFSEKYDLYLLIQSEFPEISGKKCFSDLRIEAEAEAERKKDNKYNLSDIYEILGKKSKIPDEILSRIMNHECELTAKFAVPRNLGKLLFRRASERRKKIIITADTIYPKNVIVQILRNCGYENHSELIILNKSECKNKHENEFFAEILGKSGVSAEQLIHIGTDVADDVEIPIMNGSKALLSADSLQNMIKSCRIRRYVQARQLYDYDSADFLALHLAFGLFAAYIFDIPRKGQLHSDFCNNPYILGFFVYGCCKVSGNIPDGSIQKILAQAMEQNSDMKRGGVDFENLFRRHFQEFSGKISMRGMNLPLEFIAQHCGESDRKMFRKFIPAENMTEWENIISEPDTAPMHRQRSEQNSLEKLADRMFPPGTRVRNITDGILVKIKGKTRF